MTVDLDLLADYLGGALDGTPRAATVERLIADDPAWAEAYARLRVAVEAVQVDLRTLEPESMPADVAGRIEGVLGPVPERVVVPLAPRRRWTRRAAPMAIAAGVLIAVGVGATALWQEPGGEDGGRGSAVSAPDARDNQERATGSSPQMAQGEAAPQDSSRAGVPEKPLQADESPEVIASGVDYRRDTVRSFAVGDRSKTAPDPTTVPAPLHRLIADAALAACVAAIRDAHNQPAATVSLVDLARYEGAPAVVVRLSDGWVWVSGPDCGLAGPDTRARVPTR